MDMFVRLIIGVVGILAVSWGTVVIVYETVGCNVGSTIGAFAVMVIGIGLISKWFWSAYQPVDYDSDK